MIMKCFKDRYFKPYDCHHIASIHHATQDIPLNKGNLFLSGTRGLDKHVVQDYGISSILTIIDKWSYEYNKIDKKINVLDLKDHHKWIDLQDHPDYNIYPHFDQAVEFIKTKLEDRNVLVHCYMGISRSASLVLAFLMKEFRMSLADAYNHTVGIRNIIEPNQTFWKDLQKYEKDLIQKGIIVQEKK